MTIKTADVNHAAYRMIITTRLKYVFLFSLLVLSACSKPPFTDSNGNGVFLSSDKDQWLALNIWAQWCGPCREEIPELNELEKEGTVRVIGADFDGSQGAALKEKVVALGIRFPVIEQSPFNHLGAKAPQALPATLIINPQGKLVDTLYGPQTRLTLERRIGKLKENASDG